MSYNNISTIKFKVECTKKDIAVFVIEANKLPIKNIYSYIIKNKFREEKKESWIININCIDTEEFNIYDYNKVILEIENILNKDLIAQNKKQYLAYKQPPLQIMLSLFDPLILKFAIEQQQKWNLYELDDLAQICRQCMLDLYNKNYYIHKALLKKTFINRILYEMRKYKNCSQLIPLSNLDKEEFEESYSDSLVDNNKIIAEETDEENSLFINLFDEIKLILIENFGDRRVDSCGGRSRATVGGIKTVVNEVCKYP